MLRPGIDIVKLYPDADVSLQPATSGSVCIDLHAYDVNLKAGQKIAMAPGDTAIVGTGIAIAIPEGYEGRVRPRSGHAAKFNITVANAPGTIDQDYRGEIKVILHRLRYDVLSDPKGAKDLFYIEQGDRIAQFFVGFAPKPLYTIVKSLDKTERGDGGIGHTGIAAVSTPVTTLPPSEFTKTREDEKRFPPILQPVFRALTTDQRHQLLAMTNPATILLDVYNLQDQSEWDIPANTNRPSPLTYSQAFDYVVRNPGKERHDGPR